MLTGHGNETVAVEALKKGAQDYVVKRLAGENLPGIVGAAIERVALSHQVEQQRREVQRLAEERTLLIDQLQQQTAELKEADRRKDEFLRGARHELRNPLGPIRNAAKILGLPPAPDGGHAQAREVIERQVAHMGRLIDDLLDVSRITRGKILLRRERVDLVALARDIASDHRAGIEAADLTLTLDLPGAPAWANGDPTRLSQIIGNLLHNATKFTDAGGSITLSLHRAGDSAVITVSDTGIGMDAKLLARAFESFNQADKSLDRSRGGLGLGLALSKGLIELHGGQVKADSDGAGKGSRITVTVPLDQSPARSSLAPSITKPAVSWRVLVIEDNMDAAKTLASLLRIYGHKTCVAHSGTQGIQTAREFKPDVVLCDIGLPGGVDGYAVAKTIRSDSDIRSAYLVAISGYGQDDDIQQSRDAGFNLHLTKPVDPARLQKLLAALCLPQDSLLMGTIEPTTFDGGQTPRA